jgi:hypothetical protein
MLSVTYAKCNLCMGNTLALNAEFRYAECLCAQIMIAGDKKTLAYFVAASMTNKKKYYQIFHLF